MNFFVKGLAIDSQALWSLALVAAGFFQNFDDMFFFNIFQGPRSVAPKCLLNGKIRRQIIRHNNIKGNVLLPFDWGEYAMWQLYPDCRVSIDGRFRTVYPESVIQDHFISDHDTSRWIHLLEKYPSDIIIARQIPFFQGLIRHENPWVYVYSDPIAIVFLHNTDKNKEALERFKAGRFEYPEGPPSIYFP